MNYHVKEINRMIMIGSTGQNSGKTTLAEALIRSWKPVVPIVGLKVTTIKDHDSKCPRGGDGCGACDLENGYCLTREENIFGDKDTAKLLRAGANQVFWLRVYQDCLQDGLERFLRESIPDALIICESNSLRQLVKPGCFIMINNKSENKVKTSAIAVLSYSDLMLKARVRSYNTGEIISYLETVYGYPLSISKNKLAEIGYNSLIKDAYLSNQTKELIL